jgi:alanyl-tRNA synthetase
MHSPRYDISAEELRHRYLTFFAERGHASIPSASLVPVNDPTVLFTTAGMHPLVPHLLGAPHPAGRRLVNVQKCVRTGDIDVVGDDTHLTFFEMLGNWSLGDYFREEAIRYSFEFLTEPRWLNLPLDRLGVTCFGGDSVVPADDDSVRLWERLGVPPRRIALLGREDNWWGPAGKSGPCGPDTEIFFWVGDEPAPDEFDVSDRRWVEIWNNVFMGFDQTPEGEIRRLSQVNVDTGMGLERTLVALNGLRSVYEIDSVRPVFDELGALTATSDERRLRIVTDHLRASCFMIADGVGPSNRDRGYVLRRLLRRAILFARELGLPEDWHVRGWQALHRSQGRAHPELAGSISDTIECEARRFEQTLAKGLREIEKRSFIDGAVAFDLFQTYGFPFELTRDVASRRGAPVDERAFQEELERHRQQSRKLSGGAFRGGLADHGDATVRYHTLTHLLQAALRSELGDHVLQRGSNITAERLRFDFSHDGKPTREKLENVRSRVNGWLTRDLVVVREVMTEPQARAIGAIGAFGEKYGETVSVYTIRDPSNGEVISREFCAGPHVTSTRELRGRLEILREEALSSGVRRIKAVFVPDDEGA